MWCLGIFPIPHTCFFYDTRITETPFLYIQFLTAVLPLFMHTGKQRKD